MELQHLESASSRQEELRLRLRLRLRPTSANEAGPIELLVVVEDEDEAAIPENTLLGKPEGTRLVRVDCHRDLGL